MIALDLQNRSVSSGLLPALSQELSKLTEYQGLITARVETRGTVQELNVQYAGQDTPTDVLSFSYVEDAAPETTAQETLLGDIAISRWHIFQQARWAHTSADTECVLLLLHGALHILGYDHQTRQQRADMDGLQREIMNKLKLEYRDFQWQSPKTFS